MSDSPHKPHVTWTTCPTTHMSDITTCPTCHLSDMLLVRHITYMTTHLSDNTLVRHAHFLHYNALHYTTKHCTLYVITLNYFTLLYGQCGFSGAVSVHCRILQCNELYLAVPLCKCSPRKTLIEIVPSALTSNNCAYWIWRTEWWSCKSVLYHTWIPNRLSIFLILAF